MTEGRKNGKPKSLVPTALSAFRIEADLHTLGFSFLISGISGIEEFSSESVLLRAGSFSLRIEGSALGISIYENHSVEIIGRVFKVEFL